MKYSRRLIVLGCALALATCSGCLITRHTTNVVRKNEKPRAVRFESAQAKNVFDGKVLETREKLASMSNPRVVAVPFLLWWSSTDMLSDNALRNDQLSICDVNGDGVISLAEANVFAAKVDERLAEQEREAEQTASLPAAAADGPAKQSYPAQPVSAQEPK